MNYFYNPYYYPNEPTNYFWNPNMYYWNPWHPQNMKAHYRAFQNDSSNFGRPNPIVDKGPEPFTVNIEKAAKENTAFRRALWTGPHLQLTLMSLQPGEDIGLEIHPHTDQFLRIEQGEGIVEMGRTRNNLSYRRRVHEDSAIMVPAGTWHNVINTGKIPMKLYSIYAPPNHPHGTVHRTKAEAMAQEHYGHQ